MQLFSIKRLGLLASLTSLVSLTLAGCASTSGTAVKPAAVPFVLMGEVHDNPDGHQQRTKLIAARIAQGDRPALVMEQFDRENNTALQEALTSCTDAPCVISRAGGQRWDWPLYYPLIELALQYRLPVIAANVSRTDATKIRQQGWQAIFSEAEMKQWQLPHSVPADLRIGQENAIVSGHCNQRPPQAMLDGFVDAQIARDIWMAHTMIAHAQHGAILIAGNGHVRNDLGVPFWLKTQGKTAIQSIGFLEAPTDTTQQSYDNVYTIAAHQRPDPCAAFSIPSHPKAPAK
jgi:uncharacterized iron-regulated protein